MLRLDPSIIPNPDKPEMYDAYGSAPGLHECVLAGESYDDINDNHRVGFAIRGKFRFVPKETFEILIASLGLIPTGRMTSEPLPASDPADQPFMEADHRAVAQRMGPGLRVYRQTHEVTLGQLARALGIQTAVLSAFELGERPGDPQPLGTAAMDRSLSCGGVLTYEAMAGAFRVHKAGVYKFRCPKCGAEGTNNGEARTCDYPAADPTALDPATETARDTLVDLLAAAVLDSPKGVASEADIKVALHDALNSPKARAAMRLHEAEDERVYSLLQTIEEAAGMLANESIVSDTQHLQEAMEHASKHLRKTLPTAPPATESTPPLTAKRSPTAEIRVDGVATGHIVCLTGEPLRLSNADNTGVTSWRWSIEAPPGSAVRLGSPAMSTTTFEPDIRGDYAIHLHVNRGASNRERSTLTVRAS